MLTLSMHAGRLDIISETRVLPIPITLSLTPSLMTTRFFTTLVLEDFNAHLIKALPSESEVVGPYTLGASLADLDCLSQAQQDNRSRFIEFCLSRNMVAKNTFLEQLVTYKSVGVKSWHPPWQLHKYAQMDFVVVNQKWKNAVANVYIYIYTHIHVCHSRPHSSHGSQTHDCRGNVQAESQGEEFPCKPYQVSNPISTGTDCLQS